MRDIPVATSLYWYFEMRPANPEIPHVRRRYNDLSQRAAYQEHIKHLLMNFTVGKHFNVKAKETGPNL